eukprot:5216423-Amphidinium_carterae.1
MEAEFAEKTVLDAVVPARRRRMEYEITAHQNAPVGMRLVLPLLGSAPGPAGARNDTRFFTPSECALMSYDIFTDRAVSYELRAGEDRSKEYTVATEMITIAIPKHNKL